jgi:hypothetical protein
MTRYLPLFALPLLAACASGAQGPRYRGIELRPAANPSAVIAAEIGFAQLAQDKGQWAAFRETATADAEMFVPQRVRAQDWLKGRAEPAVAVKWQPHAVWSSCDGSYAVTRGGWESPNAAGTFATVWQRQKDGGYKWAADMSLTSGSNPAPPEMIAAKVAECAPKAPPLPVDASEIGLDRKVQTSLDNTLFWSTAVAADGSRRVAVSLWNGRGYDLVIDQHVPAAQN